VEGRYADALALVDELEGMSKQAILRNIESFLVRLLIYLKKSSRAAFRQFLLPFELQFEKLKAESSR